jgi:formylglycine-generating enzyme required for sulfatase activity
MKNYILATLLLTGTITLFEGCDRKIPDDTSSENKSESETKIESGTNMVLLPGGTFIMGDEDEIDALPHEVSVGSFYIDTHLVTQEQYEKLMEDNPSRWKGDKNPVEQMRWSDAVKYCNARSESEGHQACYDLNTWKCNFAANGYRLPTEAEWEYACRAGTTTNYFFGDDASKLKAYAWFEDNSGSKPRPVGQKPANPWGLFDMHGNVWEWCNDFYKVDYYQESPKENPRGPEAGETRVLRGGAWKFSAESCNSAYRYNENPGYADVCFGYDIYGFRCVRNAAGSAE